MYIRDGGNNVRFRVAEDGTVTIYNDLVGTEGFSVDDDATNVYDDATSNSPYSRVSADSFHTNGLGVGQIYIEGRAIDANTWIAIGVGLAGGQSPQDVKIGDNNEIYVDTSANSVGIGTTSPSAKLDVSSGDIEINNGAATGSYKVKGSRFLYAGDETEVSTTSTNYVLKKQMTAVFDSSYGSNPRYVNVIARIKNSGGYTTSLNVTMELSLIHI